MVTAIPGHYFSPRSYLKSDPATGLLATRQGNRLLAIPDQLLRSIHRALRAEAGEAAPLALYTFGFWWGTAFYDRLSKEIEFYYHKTIPNMNAVEFLVMMRQIWAVHGLGRLTLDFSYRQFGLLVVTTENSALGIGIEQGIDQGKLPSHHLEAGFIAAWFARWAGKNIRACVMDVKPIVGEEEEGDRSSLNKFLVGLASPIEQAELWVKQGVSSQEILERLAIVS